MSNSDDIRERDNREGERTDLVHLKDFARWNFFDSEDWTVLAQRTADFVGIENGDALFEAGCGSGAFLAELAAYREITMAGVDFAENLIAIARSRLTGDFQVADITDLSSVESGRYDKVLSHGVFLYLDSQDAAHKAAREMVRIAKPGGIVYIGVVNDPDRRHDYAQTPSGSFLLPRSFWREFAEREGLTIEIVDQDAIFSKASDYDAYSRIRYSLRMTKPRG